MEASEGFTRNTYDAEQTAQAVQADASTGKEAAKQAQAEAQAQQTETKVETIHYDSKVDPGYVGARIALIAHVTDPKYVDFNWKQTVTTSDPVRPGEKPNVPFNDAAPDTGLYQS